MIKAATCSISAKSGGPIVPGRSNPRANSGCTRRASPSLASIFPPGARTQWRRGTTKQFSECQTGDSGHSLKRLLRLGPLPPRLVFSKSLNIRFARPKEIQEIQPGILARLADAQKHQIFVDSLWG